MTDQFHTESFDDATRLKLEIYRGYLKEWLPVFITSVSFKSRGIGINIFDFFCGPGHDGEGNVGSPIIALRACLEYSDLCKQYGRTIHLYFSDIDKQNIATLTSYLATFPRPPCVQVHCSNSPFSDAFTERFPSMQSAANLVFLDQYGVKDVVPEVFQPIAQLAHTDLLFFTASWHAIRFRDHESILQYHQLPESAAHVTFNDAHREVTNYFRQLLAKEHDYYIAPFSLKKRSSVHGLIFGSNHLLGIEKFLRVAWRLDPNCGEANFDIDGDGFPDAHAPVKDMFASVMVAKKVEVFQQELERALRGGKLKSDLQVYAFALHDGFLPVEHAKPIVRKLLKEKVIACDGEPRLSQTCIKDPRAITLTT